MSTLGDVSTWVTTSYFKRTDITTLTIDAARQAYLVMCGRVPFDQLQAKTAETPVLANVDTYDLAYLTPGLAGIMSIRYTAGTGRMWRLRRSDTRVYDAVAFSTGQDPRTYARFGTTIELMPAPKALGPTFRIRYWSVPTLNGTLANTQLVFGFDWEELLRWETVYRVLHVLKQPEQAALLVNPMPMPRQPSPKKTIQFEMGIIPRLWNDLLLTIRQREAVDEDFSINPIQRSYTSVR